MSIDNIGVIYESMEEYKKALEWYEKALEGRESTLGPTHPDTLITVNNIGDIYNKMGDYPKMQEWYRWTLEGREESAGRHHPDTISVINDIAIAYGNNDSDYESALEWYTKAWKRYKESSLGADLVDVLETAHSIGETLCNLERYEDAVEWFEITLKGMKASSSRGPTHEDTISVVRDYVSCLVNLNGDDDERANL